MKTSVKGHMLAVVIFAVMGMGSALAQMPAAEAGTPPPVTKTKAKKKKPAKVAAAKHSNTVKFVSGSAETPAERSTRLKRECKGRVNAGACEGYTGSP
ncbi:MAG: hypothetical protein ABIP46_11350 [Polaromonas sp.]